jgi:hypothetical protein
LVADWWAAGDPERAVMIAFRRVDVADLNGRARVLMRAAGKLGIEEVALPAGRFAAGDRVVLRHNDRRLGVVNGERGVIAAVDPWARGVDVELGGRRVRLDAAYLERTGERMGPSVVHGYAITGHSAQGLTCDRAFVLVANEASREWCYTALSRGRLTNQLYAVAPEPGDRAEYAPDHNTRVDGRRALTEALTRSTAQTLATDAQSSTDLRRELLEVIADRNAAEEVYRRALRARVDLERQPTPRLAFRARHRQRERIAAACAAEAAAERRLETQWAREAELRGLVRREQRVRALPERPNVVRERDRGIDLGR